MADMDEVGDRDGWRCWLCDEAVDPDRSVNDDRGPSIDGRITRSKAKSKAKKAKQKGAGVVTERLAHRSCNTGKGNTAPVVSWSPELFVVDPAPIIPMVERLMAKGGREAVARCPTRDDADDAGQWLLDRVSRLEPLLHVEVTIDEGGGQFVVGLRVQ